MLNVSKIAFPGLGIGEFEIDSVAFTIFGLDIAWYAILITFGMIMAVIACTWRSKLSGITFDDVLDITLFTIPFGVIGARLYYVLTSLEYYHSFADVINIRGGGLAIYGGIIAGGITVLVACFVKKIDFLAFADATYPAVVLAQAIGRWGNFTNGEAYGRQTDWFCRMRLSNLHVLSDFGVQVAEVHPTFLYESLWNFAGFALAQIFYKKKQYDGQIFLFLAGWYGFGRFFIEGLRTDSLYIHPFGLDLRISQVLGMAIFLVSAAFLIFFAIRKPRKPLFYKIPKKQNSNEKK